jgi:hypothetical protein
MTNATSASGKKPKCLPQAQHRHFGYFATRSKTYYPLSKKTKRKEL